MVMSEKNLWVAAGDGDLNRVQTLIEQGLVSPDEPDAFTYTPMHAAASYGHLHVLDYLISRGGNVNVADSDGDTPLFTVENVETARFLVEHGATVHIRNNEGVSPIEQIAEDFPQVADYLRSTIPTGAPAVPSESHQPSQHQQNMISENLTSSLMLSVQEIMQRAELEGRDPEEELRQAVCRTVLEGVATGYEITVDSMETGKEEEHRGPHGVKRRRGNDGLGP